MATTNEGSLQPDNSRLILSVQESFNTQIEGNMTEIPEISLSFRGLSVWVKTVRKKFYSMKRNKKLILNSLNGDFLAGTSTAILGPSGSGKTTLMNYLTSRIRDRKMRANGRLFVNGRRFKNIKTIKHRTAYVMQEDILYEDLTVWEQLESTARLAGIEDPESTVNQVIEWLDLVECKHTRIGGYLVKGLSGGEKKRTSIATEMLVDPSMIFLDEPTTGLDSKNALILASIFQMFASNGRTVVSTIHQPSTELLSKFDKVICMCNGEIVFCGTPEELPIHFGSLGYPVPQNTNPGDHLM